jgi:hypothetical protein
MIKICAEVFMVQPESIIHGIFLGFAGKAEPKLPGHPSQEFFSASFSEFDDWCNQQNTEVRFFSRFSYRTPLGVVTEDQKTFDRTHTPNCSAYKRIHSGGGVGLWVVGTPVEDIHAQSD